MRLESIIRIRKKQNRAAFLLCAVLLLLCSLFASADSLSADNSLSSLGITTDGAVVSPEFTYGTTEYNVTVPAGTTSLSLDPTPSNSAAYIDSISGTELTDGSATVSIVVVAENGDAYTYYLYVTAEAAEAESEAQTETEVQTETEEETEDPRYVSVARETLENAENTISTLKEETSLYRDRVELMMKILYGMIALCVVLLFVVINLLLKNKDLKSELKNYRGLNYASGREQMTENEEEGRSKKKAKQKKSKKKKEKKPVIVEDTRHQQMQEEDEEDAFDRTGRDSFYEQDIPPRERERADDPATVPKPSKARSQAKRMPEYEQPKERPRYEPSKEPKNDSSEIDIDFIDL